MIDTLAAIGLALLCGGVGFLLATLWTRVYRVSATPGDWIAGPAETSRKGARRNLGAWVAFLCMLYTQGAFMVLTLGLTARFAASGTVHWPFWSAAFCVSLTPPWLARCQRTWCQGEPVEIADVASAAIELVMVPLFFLLLYVPPVVRAWAWVPFASALMPH